MNWSFHIAVVSLMAFVGVAKAGHESLQHHFANLPPVKELPRTLHATDKQGARAILYAFNVNSHPD